jgi:hypothetical protein
MILVSHVIGAFLGALLLAALLALSLSTLTWRGVTSWSRR